MSSNLKIVDADTHQIEPDDLWERFIDDDYKDRMPQKSEFGGEVLWGIEGEPFVNNTLAKLKHSDGATAGNVAAPPAWGEKIWNERMKAAKESGFSAASRIDDMDMGGVDVQVIYPTLGGQVVGREFKDPELLAACCRAYNDWSRDYCQLAPDRLRWAALLPLQSPDLAIEEAQRTAKAGAVGFYVRPNPVMSRNLHDDAYSELWSTIEVLDKPVSLHNSHASWLPNFGDRLDSHTSSHVISHPFEAMASICDLILFGVFERFPRLTFVNVECNAGWLPFLLERIDNHYSYTGSADHPELTMAPSEYWQRNMFIASGGDEHMVPAVLEYIGDDNVVFNTDYPHADGSWPQGIKQMEEQPISPESLQKIFWDNAVRAFRLEA